MRASLTSVNTVVFQFHENSRSSLSGCRPCQASSLVPANRPLSSSDARIARFPFERQNIGDREPGQPGRVPVARFSTGLARNGQGQPESQVDLHEAPAQAAGRGCDPDDSPQMLTSGLPGSVQDLDAAGSARVDTNDPAAGSSRAPPPSGRTARRRLRSASTWQLAASSGGNASRFRLTFRPIPITAPHRARADRARRACHVGPCLAPTTRSTRMPAIFRPSIRTSLGHLIRGVAAGPGGDQLGGRHRAQRGQPGAARTPPRGGRGQVRGRKQHDRHQDRRTRRRRPRPSPATSAGRLLLGQDHQAIVGRRRSRPRSQIVGARDSVPDRDPPSDPPRRQTMLDLVGTEPLGPAHGRRRPDRGAARPQSRKSQGHPARIAPARGPDPAHRSGT